MNELGNFIGREGFVWWIGVVEDRQDPEKLGRVRVRCFGWHTEDKALIPTNSLPWAYILQSSNVPASYTPKEGDWVIGFWADGNNAQTPVVMGTLQGKPKNKPDTAKGFSDSSGIYPKRLNESTLNRLSRGRVDGTIHETRRRNLKTGVKIAGSGSTWNEPAPTFAPTYPYNFAIESESGHVFELDDTKGNERVNLSHKNGSYFEMDAIGNRIDKITKDKFTIVVGDDFVSVVGNCNLTVEGNCNLKSIGDLNIESKNINISASKNIKFKAGSKLMLEGSSVDIKSSNDTKIGAGGKMSVKGKSSTLQGNTIKLAGKISNKVKVKSKLGVILPTGSASSPSDTGLKTP